MPRKQGIRLHIDDRVLICRQSSLRILSLTALYITPGPIMIMTGNYRHTSKAGSKAPRAVITAITARRMGRGLD